MCGRLSIIRKQAVLEKRYNAQFKAEDVDLVNSLPNYNVCPTTFIPVISSSNTSEFRLYYWGLDFQAWDGKIHKNTINARLENVLKIGLFKESLNLRRCLVPATSYFEWKSINNGKTKIPYLVKLKSLDIFSLAGLWVPQEDANGNMIEKFILLTQQPTQSLSFIHNRMPGILTPENEMNWLDKNVKGEDALKLINQHPDGDISFHPVTNELNRSFDNKPEFIKETVFKIEEQGKLF